MVNHDNFGSFLKYHREKKGFSQGNLSKILGYKSPQFVSNWERNISLPPMTMLAEISSVLKIKKNDVIDMLTVEYRKKIEKKLKRKIA